MGLAILLEAEAAKTWSKYNSVLELNSSGPRSRGLDLMPGIETNVMTYTAAINSCESAAKWPEAMQLLVNMQESDLLVF